jgi:hypothetical protein
MRGIERTQQWVYFTVSSLITGLANETALYGSDRIGLALGRAVACEGGSEAALHG